MMRFAVIGIDHRHIYHMIGGLLEAGAECAGFVEASSDPIVLKGLKERFPDIRPVADADVFLNDTSIDIIVTAAIPSDRAAIATAAMLAGKDVMTDKPGIVSLLQLSEIQQVVAETGRIFSICFSERFIVPAVGLAQKLVADGAIGRVIQTMGMGPHRFNRAIRPEWFFDAATYGGVLNDIASHQIDQFLIFSGSGDAKIINSAIAHFADNDLPDFQDFGEILLRSEKASGYIRVDWFTADGLPTWGDGRLFVHGTKGTIELRKYVDVAGRTGTDHLFLVNTEGTRHFDASTEPIEYFKQFVHDVRHRTETAMAQAHVFTVSRLALEAQRDATWIGK
ncbi:Gfo/Idh/MocA family oxidoreductase [Brucella sp. BE17]|uniref:Gfo/Idh/MocA family protein n=1 Tax=Brucella sp. BE17 TaxID=3142977 RepID=UPI0031BBC71A